MYFLIYSLRSANYRNISKYLLGFFLTASKPELYANNDTKQLHATPIKSCSPFGSKHCSISIIILLIPPSLAKWIQYVSRSDFKL